MPRAHRHIQQQTLDTFRGLLIEAERRTASISISNDIALLITQIYLEYVMACRAKTFLVRHCVHDTVAATFLVESRASTLRLSHETRVHNFPPPRSFPPAPTPRFTLLMRLLNAAGVTVENRMFDLFVSLSTHLLSRGANLAEAFIRTPCLFERPISQHTTKKG